MVNQREYKNDKHCYSTSQALSRHFLPFELETAKERQIREANNVEYCSNPFRKLWDARIGNGTTIDPDILARIGVSGTTSRLIIDEVVHAPLGSVEVGNDDEVGSHYDKLHARQTVLLDPVETLCLLEGPFALTNRHHFLQFAVIN